MKISRRRFTDYLLLSLFIASSGIPYFAAAPVYVFQAIVLLTIFILRMKSFDHIAISFFTGLLTLSFLQCIVFDFFPAITIFGLLARVLAAYLIIKLLSENFIKYYIRIMYIIALISWIFFFPILVIPSIGTALLNLAQLFNWMDPTTLYKTILIYNLSHLTSFRNSGPFWEPGAFAGYLTLAFVFSYTIKPKLFNKQNGVLLLTLLSTQSTTAFIALFIFLCFANYKYINNIFIKIFAVAIIGISGYYAFTSLDFLGEKIFAQLKIAQTSSIQTNDNSQRFLNIIRDFKDLEGHEILGRGANAETRYSFGPITQIRTVGWSDVLVKFGIPFFLLMMYMMYKSIDRFTHYQLQHKSHLYNIGIFITILITLMSEVYFNFPMYWSLLFLIFTYKLPRRIT